MKKKAIGNCSCLMMALILGGNPAEAEQSVSAPPLASHVQFDLTISDQYLSQFSVPVTAEPLRKLVINHLAEWGYPFPDTAPYSHQIQASLGEITKQQTPVGFSFTYGNSDPRGTDFQKAQVLPISCKILAGSSEIIEKNQTVSARPLTEVTDPNKLMRGLADEISSVCLEMLEQAPLPKAANNSTNERKILHPKWLPNIQIEVKEPANALSTPATAIPAAQEAPLSTTTPTTPKPEDNQQPGKKQIIINNQGSPLILEFGHERR